MPRGYEVERVATRPARLANVLARLGSARARLIALDERGRDLDSSAFAKLLDREAVFVIGGPDGLDAEIKGQAALLLRLSSLTLPHALAQVVLLEQLYRAATLRCGHPYHRV